MVIKKFQSVGTSSGSTDDLERVVSVVQGRVADAIDRIAGIPTLDGSMLSGVILTAGIDNFVSHGLGRKFLGWHVVDRTPDAGVFESATTNKSPDKFILLNSNADVTITLWAF